MIYLDNAATSYPKPESVYRAAARCMRYDGGNPGRSSHRLAAAAAERIYEGREAVASLFGGRPENVVFTLNATYALNLAIQAFLRPGGTVLLSSIEHNAVLRPVAALSDCRYELFSALGSQEEILRSFRAKLEKRPSLVVCNHQSNLCGLCLPVEKIGALCAARGIPFVIDASQSAGHRPLSLAASHADVICAPGHKGLYGLPGCGFALFADRYADGAGGLRLFVSGGNGVDSLERRMPDFLPERYEAGTLPTPAVASLAAGIREIERIGLDAIAAHEEALGRALIEGLSGLRGVRVYGGEYGGGTVLFTHDTLPPEALGEFLDRRGIAVRCGYHCSPLGHQTLGTPTGGAVRASFSYFNRRSDVEALLRAVKDASR